MEHNDFCKGLEKENQLRSITHYGRLDGTTDCNCGCHLRHREIRRKVKEATEAVGATVIRSLKTTPKMPSNDNAAVEYVTYRLQNKDKDKYKQVYDMLDPWIRDEIEADKPVDVFPILYGTVEFTFKLPREKFFEFTRTTLKLLSSRGHPSKYANKSKP